MTDTNELDLDREWNPLSPEEHTAQLAALQRHLAPHEHPRVLDLGAGDGRIAAPLARAGAHVVAADNHPAALAALRAHHAALPNLRPTDADFTRPPLPTGDHARLDAVLCLGHTFMSVTDPLDALALLRDVRSTLTADGFFAIDDILTDTWRDVAEGNWAAGFAEELPDDIEDDQAEPTDARLMQLVFAERDPVVAFRYDDDVDEQRPHPDSRDRALRLYTLGELRLLADAAGFQEPQVLRRDCLIRFLPADAARPG